MSSGPDLQIWLTICIAIERYLSMTRYQWAKSRFTQPRVSAFIWGTAGLCLLLNSPFWFLFYLQPELKLDDAAASTSSPAALLLANISSRQTCAQTTSPGDHWATQTRTISPVDTTAPTSGGGTAPTGQPNWSRGPDAAATAIRTPQPTGDFVRCQTTFYRSEAYSSYSYARLAVVQFGPLLVLVFFNCLLIVITFLHRQRRRRINSRDARHPHAAAAAHSGTHNETKTKCCTARALVSRHSSEIILHRRSAEPQWRQEPRARVVLELLSEERNARAVQYARRVQVERRCVAARRCPRAQSHRRERHERHERAHAARQHHQQREYLDVDAQLGARLAARLRLARPEFGAAVGGRRSTRGRPAAARALLARAVVRSGWSGGQGPARRAPLYQVDRLLLARRSDDLRVLQQTRGTGAARRLPSFA